MVIKRLVYLSHKTPQWKDMRPTLRRAMRILSRSTNLPTEWRLLAEPNLTFEELLFPRALLALEPAPGESIMCDEPMSDTGPWWEELCSEGKLFPRSRALVLPSSICSMSKSVDPFSFGWKSLGVRCETMDFLKEMAVTTISSFSSEVISWQVHDYPISVWFNFN